MPTKTAGATTIRCRTLLLVLPLLLLMGCLNPANSECDAAPDESCERGTEVSGGGTGSAGGGGEGGGMGGGGGASTLTVSAKRAVRPLSIDGRLHDSAWALSESISRTTTGTNNNTSTFGVLWDDVYLYVAAQVLDSSLQNDSQLAWSDDSFEIYVDGRGERSPSYDDNDLHLVKGWNDPALVAFPSKGATGVLHATADIVGGYTVEMAIPWSNLGVTPAAQTLLGFDVQQNDDDLNADGGGGDREGTMSWNAAVDTNSLSTAEFGSLRLSSEPAGTLGDGGTDGGIAADGGNATDGGIAADGGKPTDGGRVTDIHPNLFINSREIAAIKEKVDAGLAPWKGEYDRMIRDANAALSAPAQSVTYGGKTPLSGDIHDFYVDPTYVQGMDGVPYPNRDRYDMDAFQGLTGPVRKLGLAYAFTHDARYAAKAISLIRTFCLDPATRMNPKFTVWDSGIIFTNQGVILLYGVDLIRDYPGWTTSELAALNLWVRTLAEGAKRYIGTNQNFDNWKVLFVSAAGAVIEDPALRTWAFDEWKRLLSVQVRADGALINELTRTNSLGYSMYSLQPMAMGAEVARHFGVNLYDYRLSDGRSLEKVFDFYVPFVLDPASWRYPQMETFSGDHLGAFEGAYLWKDKPTYKAVVDRWTRPYDYLGFTTLTHARGAYPFQIVQPGGP